MRKAESIDQYISTYPENVRAILEKLRRTIRESAPGAEETISYGIPTFKLNGNLVHFGAYEKHVGFYPTPSGIVAFKKELSKYMISKGTARFPIDEPVPYNLIRKIVKFRVKENLRRKKNA